MCGSHCPGTGSHKLKATEFKSTCSYLSEVSPDKQCSRSVQEGDAYAAQLPSHKAVGSFQPPSVFRQKFIVDPFCKIRNAKYK